MNHELIINQFKEEMAGLGVKVSNVYFSGFGSQGDGVCFDGKVSDWSKFLPLVGYPDPVLIDHACKYWCFISGHRGRYYHEYAVYFDYCIPMPESDTDEEGFIEAFGPYKDAFRNQAWFSILNQFSHINFPEVFAEVFRNHMRRLYRLLEEEYDESCELPC